MPSLLHQHTPSLTAFDPRGLNVRAVAYHRENTQDEPQSRIQRNVFSSRGTLKEQWDPRLSSLHELDASLRPSQRLEHSLSGRLLSTHGVDQGWRISVLGSAGQLIECRDSRGACQAFAYDELLRLTRRTEQASNEETFTTVEQLRYAASTPIDAARNRCGRLIIHDDPAGKLTFESYDLLGQLSIQTRHFTDALPVIAGHTSAWRYQALGQLVEQTDAKGNLQHSRYAVDGLLASVGVTLAGGREQSLLQQRTYSASGQVLSEQAGNGVVSVLDYNARDQRLQRLRSYRAGRATEPLQDLSYVYDRVGNVLNVRDAAQPVQWSGNTRTEAQNTYRYDTLYQLIEATGRERARSVRGPEFLVPVVFGSTQEHLCRTYRQHYAYDAGGNLSTLQHLPAQATGYTRQMSIAPRSNHSLQLASGADSPGLGSGFDQNGNQIALEPGQTLSWNVRNQLLRVTQVVRAEGEDDHEFYRYDGEGQRVLKVRCSLAKNQRHRSEVRYLPGLEIRRNSATGEWLNALVVAGGLNSVRILQWEQGCPAGVKNEHVRYSLSDHLGSSTLELDDQALVLSQETYYPYGGTAWWAARNTLQASFKTIRFSGKERDASGLYYFGYRYYAPWLSRWISTDPAGAIDGLNLYAMARGNPVSYRDSQGLVSEPPKITRFSGFRGVLSQLAQRVRPVVQAASSAAIRDSLATYASNAIGAGVDLLLFAGRQPTRMLNTLLRQVVAGLDAMAVLHMSVGVSSNWTRWSPVIGFISSVAADRGFVLQDQDSHEDEWDPVARERLVGHVRAVSREVMQQVVRGLGTSVSWGQTPLAGRVPRTLAAAGAYGLATVPNAIFNRLVPGALLPNLGPFIEGYDAAAATMLRAGHGSSVYESHVDALQLPDPAGTAHGGLSRMFNQVWGYWAGVGVESIAHYATGQSAAGQSARVRSWVAAARGVLSAFTELRGVLLLKAREGYSHLARRWSAQYR